jgi:hypothetical protein
MIERLIFTYGLMSFFTVILLLVRGISIKEILKEASVEKGAVGVGVERIMCPNCSENRIGCSTTTKTTHLKYFRPNRQAALAKLLGSNFERETPYSIAKTTAGAIQDSKSFVDILK